MDHDLEHRLAVVERDIAELFDTVRCRNPLDRPATVRDLLCLEKRLVDAFGSSEVAPLVDQVLTSLLARSRATTTRLRAVSAALSALDAQTPPVRNMPNPSTGAPEPHSP